MPRNRNFKVTKKQRDSLDSLKRWIAEKGYKLFSPRPHLCEHTELDLIAVLPGDPEDWVFHIFPTDRGNIMVRSFDSQPRGSRLLNDVPSWHRKEWKLRLSIKRPGDNDSRHWLTLLSDQSREEARLLGYQ